MRSPTTSYRCPLCGKESWHPADVVQGYCNACHAFTRECSVCRADTTGGVVAGNIALCVDHRSLTDVV